MSKIKSNYDSPMIFAISDRRLNKRSSFVVFCCFFFTVAVVTLCGTSQINNGREQSKLWNIFYSGHKRAMVSERLQDQCAKTGSFKIEDGPVIGKLVAYKRVFLVETWHLY